ncbi:hypothetical protein WSI_02070 [Candidatus Liberibacter asiaticus str. gxpsy]|uniref:Uncharacterized protein n=2 Tax=Liberibacter asiaticus TaxID=34021 RepID=C6XH49_LIBAP|nr:hypothetical protein CLIBASIA_03352 [Candidatus Liberibacter asiaticus str. psy62]AGH16784.1 hypothetical protein WSI_02070 [Candidatus Liberibacter asiaticus str. gxpsy]BAP26304.1 hypothetical protein CGUJ_03352 [Candidatus Liberibacter asiaticus str. Ishi-1]
MMFWHCDSRFAEDKPDIQGFLSYGSSTIYHTTALREWSTIWSSEFFMESEDGTLHFL